jgi:hypothetical protein
VDRGLVFEQEAAAQMKKTSHDEELFVWIQISRFFMNWICEFPQYLNLQKSSLDIHARCLIADKTDTLCIFGIC